MLAISYYLQAIYPQPRPHIMKHPLSSVLCGLIFIFLTHSSTSNPAVNFNSLNIITEEFPPFNYSENGQPTGSSVELLLKASAAVGSPISRDRIKIAPWARAYQTALSSTDVMLFSTTRNKERENLFKWAGPIGQNRTVIFAKKSAGIGQIDDMSTIDKKLVVIRDSVDDQQIVKANTPSKMITRTTKPDAAAKMLATGRVGLWAYNEVTALEILKRNNRNIDDYEIVHILSSDEMYFAFSKDVDDSVIQLLQKGIDQVR
jgi:polar amino acid transport system substrate-binding protein